MNLIQKNAWRALPALALCLMAGNPVGAASIAWDTPTLISADTDVSTAGTLFYAYTFGDPGMNTASVNGVTFAKFGVTHLSQTTVTVERVSLDVDGFHQFYSVMTRLRVRICALREPLEHLPRVAGERCLHRHLQRIPDPDAGGLDLGQSYLVQFWSSDAGALTFHTAGTTHTSGNAVTLDNNNTDAAGGVGQWVTGSFTADAATQVLTIESSVLLDLPAINAFQGAGGADTRAGHAGAAGVGCGDHRRMRLAPPARWPGVKSALS